MKRKRDLFKEDSGNQGGEIPPLPIDEEAVAGTTSVPLTLELIIEKKCPDCSSKDISFEGNDGLCNECGYNAPKEDFEKKPETIKEEKAKEAQRKGISSPFINKIKPKIVVPKPKIDKKIIARVRQRMVMKVLSSLVLFLQIFVSKIKKTLTLMVDGKFFTGVFAMAFMFFGACYMYQGLNGVEIWKNLLSVSVLLLIALLGNYFSDK